MAASTVATSLGALKNIFSPRRVAFMGYKNNPALALIPKYTNFGGDFFKIPLFFADSQGGSRVFATAQANKSAMGLDAFYVTRKKDYSLASIELEAILASENDQGAFIRLGTTAVESAVRTAGRNLAVSMYRNSGGARGQVGSVSTTTLTLKNINDIVNFEKGMKVTSSNTDGTSGADDAQELTITAINRSAGTLTTSVTWTAGGNFSNDDYLFRSGDFGASVSGFDDWIPATAPGATTFFGVARNQDVTRLGGLRYGDGSETIVETLLGAESLASREGSEPNVVFMNPFDFNDTRKSLSGQIRYEAMKSPDLAAVSFNGIVLPGSTGNIKVVQDRNCPQGTAWMLDLNSWVLPSLGGAPRVLNNPKMGPSEFLWDYNADSVEIRVGFYGNVACYNPGANVRVTLPTAA